MTAKLNERSYAFAKDQINSGNVVLDQRDDWSEHQPSARQENEFIEAHGWDEYANWHLAIDDEASAAHQGQVQIPVRRFHPGATAAASWPRSHGPAAPTTATSRTRPSGCAN